MFYASLLFVLSLVGSTRAGSRRPTIYNHCEMSGAERVTWRAQRLLSTFVYSAALIRITRHMPLRAVT